MSRLRDQVVVITGASSGIGEATARALAKKGANVVLSARREERLTEIAGKIKQNGGTAIYMKTDVASREDVQKLADFTVENFGTIDVWINNAGIMPISYLEKLKVDDWDLMIDVNIKGVLYGIAAALPVMQKKQQGHIINLSSVTGHRVGPGSAVYSGTKFAVRAITEGLRQEVSSQNIRATIISPGFVETDIIQTVNDKEALTALKKRATDRKLDPEDIAASIVYAIEQPEHVSVNEIIVRPTSQQS